MKYVIQKRIYYIVGFILWTNSKSQWTIWILFDRYINLVRDCEFGNEAEIVRDRLVFGSADNETKQTIIRMENVSLEDVIKLFTVAELEKLQVKSICKQLILTKLMLLENVKIQKVKEIWNFPKVNLKTLLNVNGVVNIMRKIKISVLPKEKNLQNAVSTTILQVYVKQEWKRKLKLINSGENQEENEYYCGSINEVKQINNISWTEKVLIENHIDIYFKLDTGSDVNIIPINLFKNICKNFDMVTLNTC